MSVSLKEIKDKIKKKIDKILKKDKWKLYLYYKNQCIKRLYIEDSEQVFSTVYKVKFIEKKKKEIYIEVKDYIGGEIE